MPEKKLYRALTKDEKRVISLLKKIDKIVGESDCCHFELFGQAGYQLHMILDPDNDELEHIVDGILRVRDDLIAWSSESIRGNGGDEDF